MMILGIWIIGGIISVIMAARKAGKIYEERVTQNLPPPEGGAVMYPVVFLSSWLFILFLLIDHEG